MWSMCTRSWVRGAGPTSDYSTLVSRQVEDHNKLFCEVSLLLPEHSSSYKQFISLAQPATLMTQVLSVVRCCSMLLGCAPSAAQSEATNHFMCPGITHKACVGNSVGLLFVTTEATVVCRDQLARSPPRGSHRRARQSQNEYTDLDRNKQEARTRLF